MQDVINWIKEHWDDVLALYGAIVIIATTVVKWTKTDKDDKILYAIISFLDNFSTAFKKSDKAIIDKAEKSENGSK